MLPSVDERNGICQVRICTVKEEVCNLKKLRAEIKSLRDQRPIILHGVELSKY